MMPGSTKALQTCRRAAVFSYLFVPVALACSHAMLQTATMRWHSPCTALAIHQRDDQVDDSRSDQNFDQVVVELLQH